MKTIHTLFSNTQLVVGIDKADDGTDFIVSVCVQGVEIIDMLLELGADIDTLLQTALQTPPKP